MNSIEHQKTELEALYESAKNIAKHTKSEATKKAYQSDYRQFDIWSASVGLQSFPAEPETVALYVVYMDKIGRKPGTIKRALSAISQAHLLAGHENPVNQRVNELKKGINRLRGVHRDKKSAITLVHLRRMLSATTKDFIGLRDRAVLLVGWTTALRRSELASLDAEYMDERAEGLSLILMRSKTDQEGQGRALGLPWVDNDTDLCAARALKRWLEISQIKNGAIFRRIGKVGYGKLLSNCGDRISSKGIANIVKRAAKRAGYDPNNFSGHSLRSGLTTTLANAGVEERRIMDITRHKSLTVLREYIEAGGLFVNHPVLELFQIKEPRNDS